MKGLWPLALAAACVPGSLLAQTGDALPRRAAAAVERFREHLPPAYFAEAHGYAVFPASKRLGFGLGAAWGRGYLIEGGEMAGRVRFWQLTSGIQTGGRAIDLIVLFRDQEAQQAFTNEGMRFMGQAGVALAGVGAAPTPGYSPGVAMFALHRFGFMLEASIGFGSFTSAPSDD